MKLSSLGYPLSVTLLLAGCVSIAPLQDTVHRFAQAAHSTATAEDAFLDSVQKVDEQTQIYQSAYQFAMAKDGVNTFDLTGKFSSAVLSPEEVNVRKALMSALTLYADKMQAIGSGDDDKQLDENAEHVAQKLIALGTAQNLSAGEISVIGPTQTAVAFIARWALDKKRSTDLKRAAADLQPHLEVVVKTLQSENNSLNHLVAANLGQVEIELRTIVAEAHAKAGPDPATNFIAAVEARRILEDARNLIGSAGNLGSPATEDFSKPVNDALEAILKGNAAIAQAGPGGLRAAATDLYDRALAARNFYQALSKS